MVEATDTFSFVIRTYSHKPHARTRSTIGHRDYGSVNQLNINKLIQL